MNISRWQAGLIALGGATLCVWNSQQKEYYHLTGDIHDKDIPFTTIFAITANFLAAIADQSRFGKFASVVINTGLGMSATYLTLKSADSSALPTSLTSFTANQPMRIMNTANLALTAIGAFKGALTSCFGQKTASTSDRDVNSIKQQMEHDRHLV